MMEPETETKRSSPFNRKWLIPGAGLLLILLIAAFYIFFRRQDNGGGRELKPERATAAAPGFTPISQDIQTPNFSQLYNNPLLFKDQVIRVTAAYTPLRPTPCSEPSGPIIHYALIAEELRMEAVGFERVLRLLPDGFTVTVDGIWRQYEGPLGCGPRPRPGAVWYLEVVRIVAPNPMPNFDAPTSDDLTATPLPGGTAVPNTTPTITNDEGTVQSPTSTIDPSVSPTPTRPASTPGTPPPGSTLTPSPGPSPTATPVVSRTPLPTPSHTPPPGTPPTITNTPPPGSSPTPTTNPFATATPNNVTITPPSPTATPDNGYPGPGTPTPTSTPLPYP